MEHTCACGCGTKFTPGRCSLWRLRTGKIDALFIQGHALKGKRNGRWRGGQTATSHGYKLVRADGHPNARSSGYILEHRLVASRVIGRPLTPDEVVHHMNHDILDNRTGNLAVTTASDHKRAHPEITTRKARVPKVCAACGVSFVKVDAGNHARAKFCSTTCRNAPGPQHPRRGR